MLVKKSTKKRANNVYVCDSCEKVLQFDERVIIDRNKKKKYDLCKDCWRKIRIIVEKHKLKKEGKEND